MIAYILKAATRAAMLDALRPLGMTYIDDEGVEHFYRPYQCSFSEHDLIIQVATFDKTNPEKWIPILPKVLIEGFWLSFITPQRNADIEALLNCLRGVDIGLAKQDGQTHEVYAKPDIDFSNVKKITPLPMGIKREYLLG